MQAVVQDLYGSADVLELRDIARPQPRDGEVLIRVRAAGVDQGVWHLMTGLPYLVRLFGYGLKKPKVPVRGREVAGVVEAVGSGVTRFAPGDEVFGTCDGSFAEYVCAKEDKVARKPLSLSFEEAGAAPISGVTALQAVRDAGHVTVGQKVLILGAGGGVGSFAVQLAKAFGAEVTGVCSTGKVELVRSLGADYVIDYRTSHIAGAGKLYDVILDTAGNRPLSLLRRLLVPKGTLVIIGGEGGGKLTGGFQRSLVAPLVSLFSGRKFKGLVAKETYLDLEALASLMEAGSVKPAVDKVFSLAEVRDAIQYLHEGRARGKVVVRV
ncbi:NADPH:quinone reductase-like Zn-dependent oxidoreductase [Arthrobacter ulcerisalmonis]|uniref:NAD(P)-dependent alcohol dehydrogenase n=1 Tax=Arthrobacter sp. B1I2 TaxID=3042263 RepID=UPI0027841241|nr:MULTISPECIES: NAD(P)-dependent alcohol dehydrogenase [Arthrobacter]MDQ0661779.1 NADPH:quinone reductase-like Zn-dependent oxidoreductase [Arthrobacter ulcerisalmonis]MDQ0729695.1 NADPH:quinone reductase-like Zn-dependent oxidoreductase [Arthrobacter sp. B1I2]